MGHGFNITLDDHCDIGCCGQFYPKHLHLTTSKSSSLACFINKAFGFQPADCQGHHIQVKKKNQQQHIKAESLEINYTISSKENKDNFLKITIGGLTGSEIIKSYTAQVNIFIIPINKFILGFPTPPCGGRYRGPERTYVKQSKRIQ